MFNKDKMLCVLRRTLVLFISQQEMNNKPALGKCLLQAIWDVYGCIEYFKADIEKSIVVSFETIGGKRYQRNDGVLDHHPLEDGD